MRIFSILLAVWVITMPALAQECTFTSECYEAESCQDTSFSVSVDMNNEKLVTDFGDLTIVATKTDGGATTIFATGDGAEYLMSRNANAARLSTHMTEGPEVITYLGTCEGKF